MAVPARLLFIHKFFNFQFSVPMTECWPYLYSSLFSLWVAGSHYAKSQVLRLPFFPHRQQVSCPSKPCQCPSKQCCCLRFTCQDQEDNHSPGCCTNTWTSSHSYLQVHCLSNTQSVHATGKSPFLTVHGNPYYLGFWQAVPSPISSWELRWSSSWGEIHPPGCSRVLLECCP